MTTTKKYTYQEEEEKLESLLFSTASYRGNTLLEKQVRLLNTCFVHLQDYTRTTPEQKADADEILNTLERHVKDLYRLHRAAKEESFYVRAFSKQITLNPYCKEEKSMDELTKMSYELMDNKIHHLRYEEIFNIYLFLDRLFEANGILDWLDLISDWKTEMQKDSRSMQESYIYKPAWTFFYFHQILEAHYVIIEAGLGSHPNTPTEYYHSDNPIIHSDVATVINPFEYLECLVFDTPILKIKADVQLLYDYATKNTSNREKSALDLINIAGYIKALMETAYLVTQTPYILEEWLKPEKWQRYSTYIRPTIEPIIFEYLSQKQQKKPYKVIKKELWSISNTNYTLDTWEEYALDPDRKLEDRHNKFIEINKIIEAIYIIYYDLLSKEQITVEEGNSKVE
ncbi:hypothetical protein [Sphingobacterium faecale]|uniref:Uncharacterized protein n=1 Tax=Sphingobacterium faecale TaxID=2803775 RepID=A0ABS1R838_9SPHI|nr:hypothetical protein [Sphingobacterium faecale]MBL1410685.1 hypothetical protein [Sphingobacterium faecale]